MTRRATKRKTHPAHKALGVPEAAERRDVVLQNGPGAAATLGSKHVEVVLPAVGLAVLLMEACSEWEETHQSGGLLQPVPVRTG